MVRGMKCDSIHGDKEQRERDRVISQFRRNGYVFNRRCCCFRGLAWRGERGPDRLPGGVGQGRRRGLHSSDWRTGRAGRRVRSLPRRRHQGERPGLMAILGMPSRCRPSWPNSRAGREGWRRGRGGRGAGGAGRAAAVAAALGRGVPWQFVWRDMWRARWRGHREQPASGNSASPRPAGPTF